MYLIHHFLEGSARRYPNKVALIHEEVRATYAEIDAKADALAHRLVDQGIARGDRVVLILENSLEYVVGYYGALKAGAVAVPLSSDIKPDGLRPLLAELESRIVVSSYRFERMLQAADLSQFKIDALVLKTPKLSWSPSPFKVFDFEDLVQDGLSETLYRHETVPDAEMRDFLEGQGSQGPARRRASSSSHKEGRRPTQRLQERAVSEREPASITYTSGSTGKPKGVMLSHRNIVSNVHSICRYLELTDKDIQMAVLPFFYVMGKSLLNTHFAVGGTVVINNKFAFPAHVLKQMEEEKVTGFSGVPSTYAYLLHRSPLAKYRDRLDSLRYCSQAGGHMSRQIKEGLRKALPDHTDIYVMYGATEASARLTYLAPERFADKMDSIGKPIPGVSLKILDDQGREAPKGRTGELVASGENIMMGYWKDPEATAKVLDRNGYHTGDLAFQDDEGFYYVSGRRDNLLKVGGHRINPQEIEDVLMSTDLLLEAVVLGLPDPLLGHKAAALAAPKENNCAEADVLALCAERLPKYKVPGALKLVRALPKNSSGKIDKPKCLELLSQSAKS